MRKQHVRIATARGQQFLASYEDVALVSVGGLDGRSGFSS
jgi:hypothetical protein